MAARKILTDIDLEALRKYPSHDDALDTVAYYNEHILPKMMALGFDVEPLDPHTKPTMADLERRKRLEKLDEEYPSDSDNWLKEEGRNDHSLTLRRALRPHAISVVSLDEERENEDGEIEEIDVEDRGQYRNDEAEAPENSSRLIAALRDLKRSVLDKQERFVLKRRLDGDTYAAIAKSCRPRLSGASQARKVEQRAIDKLRASSSRL
jgi:hypothetical protein